MSSLIIAAIITMVVFIGLVFVITRVGGNGNVRSRLDTLATTQGTYTGSEYGNPETSFLDSDEEKSGLAAMGESLLSLVGINAREREKELQLPFIRAGIYSPNAVGYYYIFRVIALPISLLLAYVLFTSPAEGAMQKLQILFAFILPILAWYGPNIYLTNAKQKRQKVLTRSFPDTLDLILVCVESGLALDAALARVCRELGRAHPEITKELNKTRMELTLLSDRAVALQNLSERTDLVAFRALVAALLQTERFGTSLTETLRVLSDDYRHQRLMAAENKAGRLPAMMTIPMILLMMPAFILIIMGPAIIQFSDVWDNSEMSQ
ncbi:MAG: type II secretion system F family protein [Alphaproteobacteria bacterium]|nr:type II secretion system F family protein [Alphaproteobacteria bacterium]